MKTADRILAALAARGGSDDDELAERLDVLRQAVNQECRRLAAKGILIREIGGVKGKIVNRLNASVPCDTVQAASPQPKRRDFGETVRRSDERVEAGERHAWLIKAREFSHVCVIDPVRGPNGALLQVLPQARYKNEENLPLNKYGAGPFCKFSIPRVHRHAGVYVIAVDGDVRYVGECADLVDRYNMGYGNISPRNCFHRGQETNCRINNLIFHAVEKGREVTLWFYPTHDYKSVESDMRQALKPEWNRI